MRGSILFRTMLWLTLCCPTTLIPLAVHAEEEEAPKPGFLNTWFLEGWDRSIALGITGTNGNNDEVKLVADIGGKYEDESHRRTLVAQFYLSDTDVGPSDKKLSIEYEENWKPFQNSFFLFGLSRYDYDRLDAWDHRIAGSAGAGSEIVSTDELKIRFSLGAGLNHTWDGLNDTTPEGSVRLSGDYIVMEDVTFATTHTYFPNFDDSSEFRIISDAGFKADIAAKGGLGIGIGVGNEYDSLAVGDNNDLTYYLRLRYEI